MKRSWKPLGVLLLVATVLWFIVGPMRGSGGGSDERPSWGSASPRATPTAPATSPTGRAGAREDQGTSRQDSSGSGGTWRSGDEPSSRSSRSPGGLFETVEEARRRYEQERGQAPRESSGRALGSAATGDRSGASPASGGARDATASAGARDTGSTGATAPSRSGGAATGGAEKIMLILDASGSMARRGAGGQTSMEAAQDATANALETVPQGTPVGLRVFGSRVDGHGRPTPAACRDTRLVQPLAPLDRRAMTTAVFSFAPLGETPIARSIDAAVRDVGDSGRRAILLVTDGEESCDPDPCRAVADARAAGVDVRVDIVGLRVDGRARDQLQCIARSTNGRYSEARDDSQLNATLRTALLRLRADQAADARSVSEAAPSAARSGDARDNWLLAVAQGRDRADAGASTSTQDSGGPSRGALLAGVLVILVLWLFLGSRRRR